MQLVHPSYVSSHPKQSTVLPTALSEEVQSQRRSTLYLPTECLQHVLLYLYPPDRTLVSCLYVCKTWFYVAVDRIYRDPWIWLNNDRLDAFEDVLAFVSRSEELILLEELRNPQLPRRPPVQICKLLKILLISSITYTTLPPFAKNFTFLRAFRDWTSDTGGDKSSTSTFQRDHHLLRRELGGKHRLRDTLQRTFINYAVRVQSIDLSLLEPGLERLCWEMRRELRNAARSHKEVNVYQKSKRPATFSWDRLQADYRHRNQWLQALYVLSEALQLIPGAKIKSLVFSAVWERAQYAPLIASPLRHLHSLDMSCVKFANDELLERLTNVCHHLQHIYLTIPDITVDFSDAAIANLIRVQKRPIISFKFSSVSPRIRRVVLTQTLEALFEGHRHSLLHLELCGLALPLVESQSRSGNDSPSTPNDTSQLHEADTDVQLTSTNRWYFPVFWNLRTFSLSQVQGLHSTTLVPLFMASRSRLENVALFATNLLDLDSIDTLLSFNMPNDCSLSEKRKICQLLKGGYPNINETELKTHLQFAQQLRIGPIPLRELHLHSFNPRIDGFPLHLPPLTSNYLSKSACQLSVLELHGLFLRQDELMTILRECCQTAEVLILGARKRSGHELAFGISESDQLARLISSLGAGRYRAHYNVQPINSGGNTTSDGQHRLMHISDTQAQGLRPYNLIDHMTHSFNPHLRILRIPMWTISDYGLSFLSRCTRLQELDVSGCNLITWSSGLRKLILRKQEIASNGTFVQGMEPYHALKWVRARDCAMIRESVRRVEGCEKWEDVVIKLWQKCHVRLVGLVYSDDPLFRHHW